MSNPAPTSPTGQISGSALVDRLLSAAQRHAEIGQAAAAASKAIKAGPQPPEGSAGQEGALSASKPQ